MSLEKILLRISGLIQEDKELHDAIVAWIHAMTESELALAQYRRRRATK